MLAKGFESAVPGLHIVGPMAVRSYGALMRFIAGAGYAARSITRAVLTQRAQPNPDGRKSIRSDLRSTENASRV